MWVWGGPCSTLSLGSLLVGSIHRWTGLQITVLRRSSLSQSAVVRSDSCWDQLAETRQAEPSRVS